MAVGKLGRRQNKRCSTNNKTKNAASKQTNKQTPLQRAPERERGERRVAARAAAVDAQLGRFNGALGHQVPVFCFVLFWFWGVSDLMMISLV